MTRRPRDPAYEKRMAYLRSTGYGGLTDAAPVQERVRLLHHVWGISYDVISERTGVDVETIKMHSRGFRWEDRKPMTQCTKGVARKILGTHFVLDDRYRVPSIGPRRMLQSLQAAGFTLKLIGELMDRDLRQVGAMATGKSSRIFFEVATAEKISQVYSKLADVDPLDMGISRRDKLCAQTWARKAGYAPPICWDDDTICDPEAVPQWTGACGTGEGRKIHKRDRIPLCPACAAIGRDGPQLPEGRKFAGAKLRAIREKAGISRSHLCRETGMDVSTVGDWETGKSAPRRQNKLDTVLAYLGAEMEDVLE